MELRSCAVLGMLDRGRTTAMGDSSQSSPDLGIGVLLAPPVRNTGTSWGLTELWTCENF